MGCHQNTFSTMPSFFLYFFFIDAKKWPWSRWPWSAHSWSFAFLANSSRRYIKPKTCIFVNFWQIGNKKGGGAFFKIQSLKADYNFSLFPSNPNSAYCKISRGKYAEYRTIIISKLKFALKVQGVQEKCVFHNSLQPFPSLHPCKRPSQQNAIVQ